MINFKSSVPLIIFSLALFQTPIMYAKPLIHDHEIHAKIFTDNLNLTDAQKKQIDKIREEGKTQQAKTYEELHDGMSQLDDLATQDTLDEKKLDEIIHRKEQVNKEGIKNLVRQRHAIYNVLNDQQKKQYTEFLKQRSNKLLTINKHLDE